MCRYAREATRQQERPNVPIKPTDTCTRIHYIPSIKYAYLCHSLEVVSVKVVVDPSPLLVLLPVDFAGRITRPEHALRPESNKHKVRCSAAHNARSTRWDAIGLHLHNKSDRHPICSKGVDSIDGVLQLSCARNTIRHAPVVHMLFTCWDGRTLSVRVPHMFPSKSPHAALFANGCEQQPDRPTIARQGKPLYMAVPKGARLSNTSLVCRRFGSPPTPYLL